MATLTTSSASAHARQLSASLPTSLAARSHTSSLHEPDSDVSDPEDDDGPDVFQDSKEYTEAQTQPPPSAALKVASPSSSSSPPVAVAPVSALPPTVTLTAVITPSPSPRSRVSVSSDPPVLPPSPSFHPPPAATVPRSLHSAVE